MSSLAEIDRDLDSIQVDSARVEAVRLAVRGRATTLAEADAELAALGSGAAPLTRPAAARPKTQPPPAPPARAKTEPPPPHVAAASVDVEADVDISSGMIDVPEEVLRRSNLPPVLALDASEAAAAPEPEPAPEPLALDLDSGETGLDDSPELPASHTAVSIPFASAQPIRPPTQPPPPMPVEAAAPADDPGADLADLLGDADPMRDDEGAAPLAPAVEDLEPESTTMFSAEDAERFSRPIDALLGDGASGDIDLGGASGDVELDLDEMVEIEDIEVAEEEAPKPVAARPPTAPPPPRTAPPPPRTAPPPPPTHPPDGPRPEGSQRGFLGKLLQRKPGS